MILSKIELNRSVPAVRAALADCQRMHSLLMGLFGTAREGSAVLYRTRLQGMEADVYLYSAVPPEPEKLVSGMTLAGYRDIGPWLDSVKCGQPLSFDLLTMPSKKITSDGKNSRRRILRTQEERMAWLKRKAEQNGFSLETVQELPAFRLTGAHGAEQGGRMYLDAYEYRGILSVTDAELFQKAMQAGIGPEKAYGMGMLLVKKI